MFVPAPMEWLKWNLPSGGVIECGSQTPQVHRDVKLPRSVAFNEGRLEDVRMLKFLIIYPLNTASIILIKKTTRRHALMYKYLFIIDTFKSWFQSLLVVVYKVVIKSTRKWISSEKCSLIF